MGNIITLGDAKKTVAKATGHQRQASAMGRKELEKAFISSQMAFKQYTQEVQPLIDLVQSVAPDVLAFAQLLQHHVGPQREDLEQCDRDDLLNRLDGMYSTAKALDTRVERGLSDDVKLQQEKSIFAAAGALLYLMRNLHAVPAAESASTDGDAE